MVAAVRHDDDDDDGGGMVTGWGGGVKIDSESEVPGVRLRGLHMAYGARCLATLGSIRARWCAVLCISYHYGRIAYLLYLVIFYHLLDARVLCP